MGKSKVLESAMRKAAPRAVPAVKGKPAEKLPRALAFAKVRASAKD